MVKDRSPSTDQVFELGVLVDGSQQHDNVIIKIQPHIEKASHVSWEEGLHYPGHITLNWRK